MAINSALLSSKCGDSRLQQNCNKEVLQLEHMFAGKHCEHTRCEVVRLCQCLLALAPPGFSILFTVQITVEAYA